uniref:Uncharacterized protein n=1 Tax=Cajanus cajan TaxID=3821 RepID=A0A151S754_CAJCA|nr:hypothetical protein KK1_027561 [Cajanus cajan]
MASPGPILPISNTLTITTEKLNGKHYLSWAASVKLWFLGQGYHDHLEMEDTDGSDEIRAKWKKLDFQLCVVLWQLVEPNILGTLLFSSMSLLKSPHLITLADGSRIASKGIGQVSLSPSLNLNCILFIPNCPFNLISLSQLTKSLNCSVTFNAKSFVIQERGTGRKIGAGHESSGLYYFETQLPVSCVAVLSPKLLHDRLGHPSLSKLKLLVPSLKNLEELGCESCQLGKHVRLSFPKQTNKRCN